MRTCIALALALSVPQIASAQAADRFAAALARFAVAVGGSYGDEGPQLTVALDAMAGALDDWDAELSQLEGVASAASGRADASSLHLELAHAYARRGSK
jgi:hypothetical protein